MADIEDLLAGIINKDPLNTKSAFDELMKDKLETAIENYKTEFARSYFGGEEGNEYDPEGDKDEVEEIELDLTPEELEALENMTDDELEKLINTPEIDDETLPLDNDEIEGEVEDNG